MPSETTYSHARDHFAALCDEVSSTREPIVIHRPGAEDVALIAADELRSLMETAYLSRSPQNAQRLLTAIERAKSVDLPITSMDSLRLEFGLDDVE